ncbi:MAG: hypothetical protein ABIG39_04915 [Candidatus Micrarchaeota archaeon]
MLFVRPDAEQNLRDRIALLRRRTANMEPDRAEEENRKLDWLEKSMDEFKNSDEFKRISEEYWSDNNVQLSFMCDLFQELSGEAEALKVSMEKAKRFKKPSVLEKMGKRMKNLTVIMHNIFEFVPVGLRTGNTVMDVCEARVKSIGNETERSVLMDEIEEKKEEMLVFSKKLFAGRKTLARLERNLKIKTASAEDVQKQRSKVAELEKKDSGLKEGLRTKENELAGMENAVLLLRETFRKRIMLLAKQSESNRISEGAGKPLKNLLLTYSLPKMRSMIEVAAATLPRERLVENEEGAIKEYSEANSKFEDEVMKAKGRARGKKAREAIDALLSGAVDHDAPEIKACVKSLEDGEIHIAEKTLEHAFQTGKVHEYMRSDLRGLMADLVKVYDAKGDISNAEGKLREAGTRMYNSRIDVMRLEYMAIGVHSWRVLWKDALLTLTWMESVGVIFTEGLRKEIEGTDSVEFMRFCNTNGFSKEQVATTGDLVNMLKSEEELLKQLRDSDVSKRIIDSEKRIAGIVLAKTYFENPVYLKSFERGEEQAVAVKERVFENVGDYSEAMGIYLDVAMKRELIGELDADLSDAAEALSDVKRLCADITDLKKRIGKLKPGKAIPYKITLGRKVKELEELLERIIGGHLEEELIARISDPKVGSKKLYEIVLSDGAIVNAIKSRMGVQRKILGELIQIEAVDSTPMAANAS